VASIVRDGLGYYPTPPLMPPEVGGLWGLPKSELTKIPGFNPNHAQDVAAAQQKFKEAGVNPGDIRAEVIADLRYGGQGELMTTVLAELGIKTTYTGGAGNINNQRLADGQFDLALVTVGITMDDPLDYYSAVLTKGAARNFGKYTNDRVDQLFRDQDRELDQAKRRTMLWEIQRTHFTDWPSIPVFWNAAGFGTRPEVFNYQIAPVSVNTSMRLEEVWLQR